MPDGAQGGGEGGGGAAGSDAKGGEEGAKHKKLLRLLTVFAYLSTVSGTAFMLSLYYLFLWTPKVQLGGKALVQDPPPPNTLALFFPEMAPQLAARVADEAPGGRRAGAPGEASESQVPATPQLVLPSMKESAEAFGKRREARSTLMEMTTTQQTPPPSATTTSSNHQWGGGEGGRGQGRAVAQTPQPSSAPPHLLPHRSKSKGGGDGEPWHSTPHPRPAEIAVHA